MSTSQNHKDQDVADGVHIVHAFSYASAALRLAAVLLATDVGKCALQTDTGTLWVLTAAPGTWEQIAGPMPVIVDATTARTLSLTDMGCLIRYTSAAAVTVTVPPNSGVPIPVGKACLHYQEGAGKVTLAGAGPPTLRSTSTLATAAQYALISSTQVAADVWVIGGERG